MPQEQHRVRNAADARSATNPSRWSRYGPLPFVGAIAVPFLLLWIGSGWNAEAAVRKPTQQEILDAIRFVESGHRDVVPDGDGGRAIGPYQIHQVYWQDAIQARPDLGGTYQDCRSRPYAEAIVTAYMQRWAPAAWSNRNAKVLARVHNGGPRGFSKKATLGYWKRVQAKLTTSEPPK